MAIRLSDHFTYRKLLLFSLPSILMMIFTSIYGVVDGYFVSNFVGKAPFAAVNLIIPFFIILGAAGTMLGVGGSALVAKTLGEGDRERANRLFSLFVYSTAASGVVLGGIGYLILRPVAALLGAEGALLEDCVLYGRWILPATPAFLLQYEFQSFFVTAEKPKLGLAVTVAAGVVNMALDAILVGVCSLGLPGAAIATSLSVFVGGFAPFVYFARPNAGLLRLGRTRWDTLAMGRACANGSSEFVSNISMSLVSMLYNYQLVRLAGEDGVAAYGVLMYVNMIFLSAFLGFSTGTAPVVAFHFGARHTEELKSLLGKSIRIIAAFSLVMFAAGELLARPLSDLFVGYDPALRALTLRGFSIFSVSFLAAGIPIYGSSFFTALNNGFVSAAISFLRTVVFNVAAVLVLPLIWGIDGVWFSAVVTEAVAAGLAVFFWLKERARYHY